MAAVKGPFDIDVFLSTFEAGRSVVLRSVKKPFFSQGERADSVFYLQSGRAKLTVVSKKGKEVTVALLAAGDFFGEESMSGDETLRSSTASAITVCSAMRIASYDMLRVLHHEHVFSDFFMQYIVMRGIRTQADFVDQLFNSSERRLARTLLMMADSGQHDVPAALIPPVTQATLADMIGTTRSRVSFFMNRFRTLGYIEYKGRIRVHKSLLNMVLHDELPEEIASRPKLLEEPSNEARIAAEATNRE
jgi:CRP/FNR family transcriptional regulator, cyclic AMP receptor protein